MGINILDFGAIGDGKTMNTQAFAKAVEAALPKKERLTIPAGVFLTGTINLKGVSLYLESGAVLKASSDMGDYPVMPFVHNELGPIQCLIYCEDANDITISGEGKIDLSGESFYDFSRPLIPKSKVPYTEAQKKEATMYHEKRPNEGLFFNKCNNLTISGITVVDAPCWTFSFSQCDNVKTLGLTIDTSLNVPNDDGMHFSSCNGVIISNCNISSGDDCVAISAITNWEKPCENVVITNCVFRSCSKAIVMGYQYSHIRNILIDNVIIYESHRGLTFMSQKGVGLVENVRVKNMMIDTRVRAGNWWGNGEAIFMMAVDHDHRIPKEQKPDITNEVNIKNVWIEGVTCTSENSLGIIGENGNIDNINLTDINFTRNDPINLPLRGNVFDIQPAEEEYIEAPENCGLYIKGAKNVNLQNVKLNPYKGAEQFIINAGE